MLLQAVKGATKHIDDPGAAVVLTLESTQISACSHGSLVSKGKFKGGCVLCKLAVVAPNT